jgi:hypothetical protein
LFASVDVVSQEQVVAFGRVAAVLEESEQIEILAVHVP